MTLLNIFNKHDKSHSSQTMYNNDYHFNKKKQLTKKRFICCDLSHIDVATLMSKIHMIVKIDCDISIAAKKLRQKKVHTKRVIFAVTFTKVIKSKMLRATVKSLNFSNRICNPITFNINHGDLNVQSVRRWRYRRPLELGSSKSKLFFVPEHPPKNIEEQVELKRLNGIYKYEFYVQFHSQFTFKMNHVK